MNRRWLHVVIGFTILLALSAALLLRVRSNYVLGKPGVKLVDVPIYNELTNVVTDTSAFLPETVGEYRSKRVEPVSLHEQSVLPPDTVYGRRIYTAEDGFQALISIVVMGTDRTSIHKPQYCLTGQGQQIVGSELIKVPIGGPEPYDLEVMKLTTKAQRHVGEGRTVEVGGVFMYWFVADGHLTAQHGKRMWLMGKELVTSGMLQRWGYVAYFSTCPPGQEEALTERLKSFMGRSVPEFQLTTGRPKGANGVEQKMAGN